MNVGLTTVKLSAATPPNLTWVTPVKQKPVMFTTVPPNAVPVFGESKVTPGGP
jgi:hypothetical protein